MKFRDLSFVFTLSICALSFAGDGDTGGNLDSEKFLATARRPPMNECWARMTGEATHKRADTDIVKAPIRLGIRFTPERTLAQIVAGTDESYTVGQSYNDASDSTSIIAGKANTTRSILSDFGLRPEDLTLSFLYWPYEKELARDSIKGFACRVFKLRSPDKKEAASVYLSTEYFFPIKVEWFKENEAKAYRTLEISSFKKEADFWLVDTLLIYGPGWKTKVDFPDSSAGLSKDGVPEDLFKKISEKP